jgi:hypothetical protein
MSWQRYKTVSPHFQLLWSRHKTAELRKDDRLLHPFYVGQTVEFRHWDDGEQTWGACAVIATISEITQFPDALKEGYVMLSLTQLINTMSNHEYMEKLNRKAEVTE